MYRRRSGASWSDGGSFRGLPEVRLSTSSLNSRRLGEFGVVFKGVKGELGVQDLLLLTSKIVSLSLELLAELVDAAELLGFGLGRR